MITDSVSQSYAIFIYECNQIEWSGSNLTYSRVGISNGMGRSEFHPSSGSASIADIDCSNSPRSTIVNVLLDLNTFTLAERVYPSTNSTSIKLSSSVSDSANARVNTLLPTPSQASTLSVSDSARPSDIAVLSTVTLLKIPTHSVSNSVSTSLTAFVLIPLKSDLVSLFDIAVVSTPSQTTLVSNSVSTSVLSTPSQIPTHSASNSVSASVLSTPSQMPTPSKSNLVSSIDIAVVASTLQMPTPLLKSSVSPSNIAVLSTLSQTPSPALNSVSTSVLLTPSQIPTSSKSVLVSPNVIAVVSNPSQTLVRIAATSTTSMAMIQGAPIITIIIIIATANQEATNTVSAATFPTSIRNIYGKHYF